MSKKIPKTSYPKVVTGQLHIAGDSEQEIPEIEISFVLDRDSSGERKIVSVLARYPNKYSASANAVMNFPESKTIVTTNDKTEAYSLMMTSLDPFILDENEEERMTDVEVYAKNTMDLELHLLLNACQVTWSMLHDATEIMDMSAYVLTRTIKAYNQNLRKQLENDQDNTDPNKDDK